MSSRHVRKVFGTDSGDFIAHPASEDEEPVIFSNPRRATKNPYELLNEMSESEAKEDDGGQADDNDNCGNKSGDSSKMEDKSHVAKKKKKKKGKHKNKLPSFDSEATEDDREVKSSKEANNDIISSVGPNCIITPVNEEFRKIFTVEYRYLNTEYELKKIFGSKALSLERGRRTQRRHRNTNLLILPRETWPSSSSTGISMQYLTTSDGFSYWKFCHSLEYQAIQKNFIRAVDSLQIESIMAILKVHTYHIDSHIQMSEMAKSGEDMQVAAELIETALHGMEAAFDPHFSLLSPMNRLEYKYQENRPFFILLFKHLAFVGQRACYRTALELCKRLLALDPENDPLCTTLMIDFYAIKSQEYEWLINLSNLWESKKNLSQLPNFAYSVALATKLLSLEAALKLGKSKSKAENNVTTINPEELCANSDKQLQYALLMFPSILRPLMDKCSIQGDTRISTHLFFNNPRSSNSRALDLLCELYVWRTHHVWKDARLFGWLEKNAHAVLDLVDVKDSLVHDYEEKRKRRYQGTPRNIIRHVLLADSKELTINLPTEVSKEPILNYDPLPPLDSVNIYNHTREISPSSSESRQGLLSMLANSILFDLNAPEAHNNAAGPAVEGAAARNQINPNNVGAGLQQSVNALLDAMRALLSDARPREDDAADGGDESDDDLPDME